MHYLVWSKAWVQAGAQEQCQNKELMEDVVRDVGEQLLVDHALQNVHDLDDLSGEVEAVPLHP